MKKIAIIQSNYIPWKGYFDLIASVDEFVIFDDVQYTRRDWRNRNKIKTAQGVQWLTVPVKTKGEYAEAIRNIKIDGEKWQTLHWRALSQSYSKSMHFQEISSILEPIYLEQSHHYLSKLNISLIKTICDYLGIKTKLHNSKDFYLPPGKTERLISICQQLQATEYLSGPSAKSYIDQSLFEAAGIKLSWMDYIGYPEYQQLHGEFIHELTILDLMFNCGKESTKFMKMGGHHDPI